MVDGWMDPDVIIAKLSVGGNLSNNNLGTRARSFRNQVKRFPLSRPCCPTATSRVLAP